MNYNSMLVFTNHQLEHLSTTPKKTTDQSLKTQPNVQSLSELCRIS
uniref:Uncharacterized protein n=1 Tax=Lepeophtheirus salmonis TaxID=72036 RepID=A0A0K2VBG4_LEPSM